MTTSLGLQQVYDIKTVSRKFRGRKAYRQHTTSIFSLQTSRSIYPWSFFL